MLVERESDYELPCESAREDGRSFDPFFWYDGMAAASTADAGITTGGPRLGINLDSMRSNCPLDVRLIKALARRPDLTVGHGGRHGA